jgi:hypothetical protein
VFDDGRVACSRVRPADLLRKVRVRLREALDVGLVDDGVVIGQIWSAVVPQSKAVSVTTDSMVWPRLSMVFGASRESKR